MDRVEAALSLTLSAAQPSHLCLVRLEGQASWVPDARGKRCGGLGSAGLPQTHMSSKKWTLKLRSA